MEESRGRVKKTNSLSKDKIDLFACKELGHYANK
jgi:hypothetical protein